MQYMFVYVYIYVWTGYSLLALLPLLSSLPLSLLPSPSLPPSLSPWGSCSGRHSCVMAKEVYILGVIF